MTVLVTCGYQEAWCDFAQSRLLHMGVEAPISSGRTDLSPNELTAKMYKALRLHRKVSSEITQVGPGKAWQIAAADMFVANADVEIWGWADPKNIHFLEFWLEFDPMCNFLLVYGSPAQSFTCRLDDQTSLPDNIDDEMEGWIKYHEALLSFYHQYPARCLLVHIGKFEKTARELTQIMDRQFDIAARQINSSHMMDESPLLHLIAQNILRNRQGDESLYLELESSADLATGLTDDADNLTRLAHEELEQTRKTGFDVELLKDKNIDLTIALEVAVSELDTSIGDLQNLAQLVASERSQKEDLQTELNVQVGLVEQAASADELDQAMSDLQYLNQLVVSERSERERLQTELNKQVELTERAASSADESDLLVMQLQQVEEELELYFKKYQELKSQADSREIPQTESSLPMGSTVDMRLFVNGTGWYDAEENGRWAGPGLTSTVIFPRLSAGSYRIEIDIVDAMLIEIVRNMTLSFNGQPLKSHLKILSNAGGKLAPLRRMKAIMQNVEKPYPARVIAQIPLDLVDVSETENVLTIVCPKSVVPASFGHADGRALSVCVQTINLAKTM